MSREHPMSCRQMAEYLSDYLDGELSTSLSALIEAHRGECPPCQAFIRTLEKSVSLVRSQPRELLPPALKKKLLEALRRAERD